MRDAMRLRSRHDRAVAALAIPALGSLVADPLLGLVDTAFVGRLGSESLAGLGIAAALFSVAFFVFNFLEYGTTSEVARSVGAGDRAAAGRAAITAGVLAVLAGIAVAALLLLLAGPMVGALGASGLVKAEAVTYVMIRALAAPAVLMVRAAHGVYRGHQNTRTPLAVALGISGLNLVLDPLFIFGAGMGVAGAAWATVIAQWLGAIVFVGLLRKGKTAYGLDGAKPVVAEVRAFLRIGRALAIRTGSLLAVFTVATAVAARVSEDAVAAHQILSQLFIFLALTVDALAIAAQALVGKYRGSRDGAAALEVSDRLLVLGAVVGLILAGGLWLLAPVIGSWFTVDSGVLVEFDQAFWLVVMIQPLGALVFVWDGVFIGLGDFTFLAGAMAASGLISGAVLILVIPLGWGLSGVWWGIVVLLAARLVTLAWRRLAARSPLRLP
ncbi:MAG: MATE family efflux transporter [Acidobacteria bacterium]|nr:MATE family efflux transporter [Acidobacteriota bacterium]